MSSLSSLGLSLASDVVLSFCLSVPNEKLRFPWCVVVCVVLLDRRKRYFAVNVVPEWYVVCLESVCKILITAKCLRRVGQK
jgi:hypothetical protein